MTESHDPPGFVPRQHPYRGLIEAEIHARPVAPLPAPVRLRRAAFMAEEGSEASLTRLARALAGRFGAPADGDARQIGYEAAGLSVTVELHNEFATITWVAPYDDWTVWPEGIGLDLFAGMPLIAAARLDMTDGREISAAALAGFSPQSLCYSHIFGGRAQIATDFVTGPDGFTRFEIAAGASGGLTRGVIARRLFEIETYRCLTLLGLPLARSLAPKARAQETRLSELMSGLSGGLGMQDNHRALDLLHDLSLEVGRSIAESSYRFAASQAYANVFRARIARLDEAPIGESTTIARYLENRIEPALATCIATEKRLLALADKLERATGLLNARISLGIESQNQAVLDTISMTARSQYRLQQTVEGLSILAISYYGVSLLGYVVDAFEPAVHLDHAVVLGLAAPIVVLLVWLGLRRVRRSHKT